MKRAVISVPERYQNIRKQNECKLFFAEQGPEGARPPGWVAARG
jgi:hypothetical protein